MKKAAASAGMTGDIREFVFRKTFQWMLGTMRKSIVSIGPPFEARSCRLDKEGIDLVDESPFSVADCWFDPWDKARSRWALKMRRTLLPREVDLGLVFISPGWAEFADEIVDVLRNSLGVPRLAGCSAKGVIANQWEFEQRRHFGQALSLAGIRIESLSFFPTIPRGGQKWQTDYWRRLIDRERKELMGGLYLLIRYRLMSVLARILGFQFPEIASLRRDCSF